MGCIWACEGDQMKIPRDIIKNCITKREKVLVDYESFEHNFLILSAIFAPVQMHYSSTTFNVEYE